MNAFVEFTRGIVEQASQTSTIGQKKTRARFPETLYVVDNNGLWVSRTLRVRTSWKDMIEARVEPTERLLAKAVRHLLMNNSSNRMAESNYCHSSIAWRFSFLGLVRRLQGLQLSKLVQPFDPAFHNVSVLVICFNSYTSYNVSQCNDLAMAFSKCPFFPPKSASVARR